MHAHEKLIEDRGVIIAKVIKNHEWPKNLKFYSTEDDFLQVATWNYNSGKHLKAHGHKICERVSNRTNELLFIKQGKLKIYFYNGRNKLIAEVVIKTGDMVVVYAGGHAYDILEDYTQVLEVKNGPYPGLELDKKVIEK